MENNSASVSCLPFASTLICSLGICFLHASAFAQTPAQVLNLPEIIVTSIRGKYELWHNVPNRTGSKPDAVLNPPQSGQPLPPVKLLPGTELRPASRSYRGSEGREVSMPDGAPDGIQHALVSLPGVGGCFIIQGSITLPGNNASADAATMTASGRLLLNIDAAKMAAHGGKVFCLKQALPSVGKTDHPNVSLTTTGGRFFIQPQGMQPDGGDYLFVCTVGVLEGTAFVQELRSKQQMNVKAGSAVIITATGINQPRPLTKAEQSYDIGCKLAVLGRDVPARLPATMKTSAPTSLPGALVNSLGMVLMPVPGTKVRMCVHETRWQDFAPYVAAVPPPADGRLRGSAHGLWGWDDHPVTATWDEAQAFCAWLSQKEGKKYRLPTDEEWSHAVGIGGKEKRSPQTTPAELSSMGLKSYPWGDAWPPPPASANIIDASNHFSAGVLDEHFVLHFDPKSYDDGFANTSPVMSFKPNKLGLYDLSGNVAEWCADWHDNQRNTRVTRGGSYVDWGERYYSSFRVPLPPEGMRSLNTGFRIVLEP